MTESTNQGTPSRPAPKLWSDNEANIDLLRFGYLAAEVADVVTAEHLLPVTVGIYGNWGSGKSTLIRMVQRTLRDRSDVMTLQFNGWLFEGYEDAKTALMGSILDAIEEHTETNKSLPQRARDLVRRLLGRVKWLQLASLAGRYVAPVAMGLPQLTLASAAQDTVSLVQTATADAEPLTVDDAKELLADAPEGQDNIRRNIRDFRRDFEDLLNQAEIKTLVVFIDDLDRCLPDTIISTLEAIKLFLFVPGTAFVIGADERLVQYAVRQRFPELPGTEVEVGRDYLEKLVQVPIRVPPLTGSDIQSYMNLLLAERLLEPEHYQSICTSLADFRPDNIASLAFDLTRAKALLPGGSVPEELQAEFDLTAQIVPVLTPGLGGNPRRAKRFLNSLLLRLSLGARRGLQLERRILAKLMLLEYIRPEFFRTLANLQAVEAGRPGAVSAVEAALRAPTMPSSAPTDDGNVEPSKSRSTSKSDVRTVAGRPAKGAPPSAEATGRLPQEDLPAEVQPWAADPWTRAWLAADPPLADVDLAPYFFIAHDQIGALAFGELRLTPAAADVVGRLLASGAPTQEIGLRRAGELVAPDAVAVFEHLAQRIRQAEVLDERSPQEILFKLIGVRPELLPQLVSLYGSLPEPKITLSTPLFLVRVTKDTPSADAARSLIDRWTRSTRTPLAQAAKAALRRR